MAKASEGGTVAVIGVGLLGTAVAQRLLQAGYQVAGYDTRPEQTAALKGQGLRAAGSIAEALQGATFAITVLPSLESAEAVFNGAGGVVASAGKGTVVLQMSTLSPELVQRLGTTCEGAGLPFVDAPISGTSAMVARGDSTMILGGEDALVQRCMPLVNAISPRHMHMGPVGAAALAKLVTNMLVALNTAAVAEALVLGAKGGLPVARTLDFLRASAAGSRMLDIRGPMMVNGEYPAQMKLELFLKDIRLMLAEGQRLGVQLPLTETANRLFLDTQARGHGGEDLAVVMTTYERLAGLHD